MNTEQCCEEYCAAHDCHKWLPCQLRTGQRRAEQSKRESRAREREQIKKKVSAKRKHAKQAKVEATQGSNQQQPARQQCQWQPRQGQPSAGPWTMQKSPDSWSQEASRKQHWATCTPAAVWSGYVKCCSCLQGVQRWRGTPALWRLVLCGPHRVRTGTDGHGRVSWPTLVRAWVGGCSFRACGSVLRRELLCELRREARIHETSRNPTALSLYTSWVRHHFTCTRVGIPRRYQSWNIEALPELECRAVTKSWNVEPLPELESRGVTSVATYQRWR